MRELLPVLRLSRSPLPDTLSVLRFGVAPPGVGPAGPARGPSSGPSESPRVLYGAGDVATPDTGQLLAPVGKRCEASGRDTCHAASAGPRRTVGIVL